MSKYSDRFEAQYKNTRVVRNLTKEINDALNKRKLQKEVDANITGVCKGKFKRRGCKK